MTKKQAPQAVKTAPKATKKAAHKATKRPLVVVRTFSAGVHIGELVRLNGKEATLANSRNLWRWRGANTLNEVASNGVSQEFTRLSEPVESIDLTEVIAVLPVSAKAAPSLITSRWGQ